MNGAVLAKVVVGLIGSNVSGLVACASTTCFSTAGVALDETFTRVTVNVLETASAPLTYTSTQYVPGGQLSASGFSVKSTLRVPPAPMSNSVSVILKFGV